MEAIYSRARKALTIDEAAKHWGVARELLIRYVLAAPNARTLACDFALPGPSSHVVEFLDMNDATPSQLTTEEYASMFSGPSGPFDWECHIVREFAVYVDHNRGGLSDARLGLMATEANDSLLSVRLELAKKRKTSRPSAQLRNIRSRLATLTGKAPSLTRDFQVVELWGEVRAWVEWDDLCQIEDDLFPTDRDIASHQSRMADPATLSRILAEAMRRQRNRPRRAAVWKAESLLREHFTEMRGLNRVPDELGANRADFLLFSARLCSLHGIPVFSDHVLRRRKKPAS